ncbi:MAG: DDE-type integrase/transposase/recombinase [Candidatus Bathyarchaeota archaeon]
MAIDGREQRGSEIANLNQVQRVDNSSYKVKSQSNNGEYEVLNSEVGWICSCPDHIYRGVKCKHIYAVEFSEKLRKEVESRRIEPITDISSCVFCNSDNIKKFGVRRNKSGDIQRFICEDCGKTFSVNIGFEKMKHNPQAITSAMQLYFSGESLRNTQKSLRLLGVNVCFKTVDNWISKYVKLMEEYIAKLKLNFSDTWRADELYVKIKGDMKYVFALMDDETRYWIAQEVADTKYTHDARRLFQLGKEVAGKTPKILITDGLRSYQSAFLDVYATNPQTATHIRDIGFGKKLHNNKMERFNGEIRDREKTMRGLKTKDTPILKGYQIYHNYIRGHSGLEGKTPAEACGIEVLGENKWKTLIQNASKK